jgi:hypothetical protein
MAGGGKGGNDEQEVKIEQQPLQYGPYSRNVLSELYGYTSRRLDEPLHADQIDALRQQERMARQGGQLVAPATSGVEDIMSSGGLAGPTDALARRLVKGQYNNPAMDETRRIAMGGDVGMNPYLEAFYERASRPLLQQLREEVNPSIDIDAASRGRGGSGMHAMLRNKAGEQTGQALTDLATGIYGGAYESDQGRRMQALGQLGALGQQDITNRLAGAGLYDVGIGRQLQAASMAPGLDAARFADAERLYQLGQQRVNAPYDIGGQYAGVLGAFPTQGGGSTQTQQMPGESPIAGGFAGGLGGAATFGALGWNPLLGGGLGAAAGLLSDERAKEDIQPVGITFGGTPLYKYRYREEVGGGPTMIGVLAQDVAKDQPDAVTMGPDGLLRVIYERVA